MTKAEPPHNITASPWRVEVTLSPSPSAARARAKDPGALEEQRTPVWEDFGDIMQRLRKLMRELNMGVKP